MIKIVLLEVELGPEIILSNLQTPGDITTWEKNSSVAELSTYGIVYHLKLLMLHLWMNQYKKTYIIGMRNWQEMLIES